jgi:hypothetical protein
MTTLDENLRGLSGLLEWQMVYDSDEGILRVKTAGPLDSHSLMDFFRAVSAAMARFSCKRVLADHRDSALRLNPVEIFDIPRALSEHGIIQHKAAVIFSRLGEDEKFAQTVCTNHGVLARMFTDADEALDWLAQDSNRISATLYF